MNNNFTMSEIWTQSSYIRYNVNELFKIGNLLFRKTGNQLVSQHFFDISIDDETVDKMKNYINEGFTFKFSYISKNVYEKLKEDFVVDLLDEWKAPKLSIDDIDKYLSNSAHSQVKRNYKRYLKEKSMYNFKVSNENYNSLKLWKDVLYIDKNCWKGQQKCDMKSLDREDLQYVFYLLQNKENSSLLVCYDNKIPVSYSLMFRANDKSEWYAVKWGASSTGRKKYLGIFALFEHLRFINKMDNIVNVDFWGRRSQTYDYLKNNDEERFHLIVSGDV